MFTCSRCGLTKAATDFWRKRTNPTGRDDICGQCRTDMRLIHENSSEGIYEMKARLVSTCFKYHWFPHLNKITHQIDHRFSITHGYRRDIPLLIISNRNNMQPLTIEDNRKKGSRSSISIYDLQQTFITDERHTRLVNMIDGQNDPDTLRTWASVAHQRNLTLESKIGTLIL